MRQLLLGFLCVAAVVITACGGGSGIPTVTPRPAMPGVARSIMPADVNGDGIPDSPVSPSLRRLIIQIPPSVQPSGVSLTRGGRSLEFSAIPTAANTGEKLVELFLSQPIGEDPVLLRAGSYEMRITPSAEAGVPEPAIKPARPGALCSDLVAPNAAVFDSPNDVQLLCANCLPSVTAELQLQCGDGATIALLPALSPRGYTLVPASPLIAGKCYRLVSSGDARDSLNRAWQCRFSLLVRPTGVVAMARADGDKDGLEDLFVFYSSSALNMIGDPNNPNQGSGVPLTCRGTGIDMAVGDFDGNGVSDIAALLLCEDGFMLQKLMGECHGGKPNYNVQTVRLTLEAPQYLTAGDIDRDGKDDIAVVSAFGQVQLMTSRAASRTIDVLAVRGLALRSNLVDVDNDGDLDLFMLCADAPSRALINKGSDGFGEKPESRELKLGIATRAAWADFETDKRLDLVLSGNIHNCRLHYDFALAAEPLAPAKPEEKFTGFSGVALARDLNADNRADLVVMREDDLGIASGFAVFVNYAQKKHEGADGVYSLEGRFVVNALEYWRGHFAFGCDNGLFLAPLSPIDLPLNETTKIRFVKAYEPMPRIPAPLSSAVADFNGDGKADVAALDADGKLTIWLAGEAGEKFAPSGDPLLLGSAGTLKAVDFDGDNWPDLLYIPADRTQRPKLLRNRDRGKMEDDLEGLLPSPPSNLLGAPALGDFDRDGKLDVLWPTDVGRLQFNEGNGRWRELRELPTVRDASSRPLYFSGELCCADFTGDGLPDVAAVMQPFGASVGEQSLVLYEGTGNGEQPFIAACTQGLRGHLFDLTPADFNADRRIDLALGFGKPNEPPTLALLSLEPSRQFTPFAGSPEARGELLDMALDDIDRDGDFDLLVAERVDGEATTTLWVNAGDGRYVKGGGAEDSLRKALSGFAAANLSLADFTGDGKPDLLAVDPDGNVVLVRSYE